MADITLADLQAKQQQLMALAEQIMHETDGNKIADMVPVVQQAGAELQAMATEFEAQQRRKLGVDDKKGFIEIALTNEQKHRIKKETGIWMDTFLMRDDSGHMSLGMPGADPANIEKQALAEAIRRKTDEEAREKARIELENQLRYLESIGPDHAAEVAKLRANPNFTGWLKR